MVNTNSGKNGAFLSGKMAKKGQKSTKEEAAAGRHNLQVWLEAHPEHGRLSHGAYSAHVKGKYNNKRHKEGKLMARIMDGLVSDLGGPDNVTTAQYLLLDNIKAKII